MKHHILISPSSFGSCGSEPLDLLKNHHYTYLLNPYKRKMTPDEIITHGKDSIGIIAGVEPLNAHVLESLPTLQIISRCGAGIDNIDLKKAAERNIIIKNTPYGPTRAVAELTIGLIFSLLRQIPQRDNGIRKGTWPKHMGHLLQHKTIGILGLGRIGKTTAELLNKLDTNVIGYDIKPDTTWHNNTNIPQVSLNELIKTSDILCIHTSYNPQQGYLIGKNELKNMKPDAYLINISRGGVVDEQALYTTLKNHHIAGAAIDVFEKEPYTGAFTTLDNTILTPHIGSYAKEARLQMEIEATKNLINALQQTKLKHITVT